MKVCSLHITRELFYKLLAVRRRGLLSVELKTTFPHIPPIGLLLRPALNELSQSSFELRSRCSAESVPPEGRNLLYF